MAKHSKAAFRYARAVFDLVQGVEGAKANDKVLSELRSFAALVRTHKDLKQIMSTPVFSHAQRKGIIEDLAKRIGLGDVARRTLFVLSEAGRLDNLEAIIERVDRLVLWESGTAFLSVTAAENLSAEEKQKIETKFHKILGKKVHASYEVDPSLIGGLQITADGRTYDGSVSGWLTTFEDQLVGQL